MKTLRFPSRRRLIVEFTLLRLVLPTVIIVGRLAPHMFLFLWTAAAISLFLYRKTPGTQGVTLWRWDQVTWAHMKPILLRWVVSVLAMIAFLYAYDPGRMFSFISEKPHI